MDGDIVVVANTAPPPCLKLKQHLLSLLLLFLPYFTYTTEAFCGDANVCATYALTTQCNKPSRCELEALEQA